MIAHLDSSRRLRAAVLLGAYAAAIALAPDAMWKGLLILPLLLVLAGWWLLLSPIRWVTWFLASAVLLPPLPMALGNSGPHPSLLLAAAGVCIGLLRIDEWRFVIDGLAAAMLAFFSILLASLTMALLYSGFAIGAASLARVALFGISIYLFLYVVHGPATHCGIDSVTSCRWLLRAAVAVAIFACVDFYFQLPAPAGFGPQFVWLDSGVYRRAQGLFYEASTLGNYCVFFLVMILTVVFRPGIRNIFSSWLLWPAGGLLALVLMLSYSRASIVNLMAATIALLWLNSKHISLRRIVTAALAVIAGGGALAWFIFPSFAELFWSRLWLSIQYFFSATEGVLSGRLGSWRILAGFLVEHPWHTLLGTGYKTLPYSDYIGSATVGDNMYLTLLVETGIPGLVAVLFLLAQILRTAYRAARSTRQSAAFLGAWCFSFWAGQALQMFSGDILTYWRVLPVYFFVLALAVREAEA